jgi:type I restriction enzyme M protein
LGAEAAEEDMEPFEENMQRLTATLVEQFQESVRLGSEIWANLNGLGYEG